MAGQPQSYGSIREFLDNLPNQPCIWQPKNANICVTCLRINEPVAKVCSVWAQALEEAPLEEIDFEEEVMSFPSVVEIEDEFEIVENIETVIPVATSVVEVDIVQTTSDWDIVIEDSNTTGEVIVAAEEVAETVIEAATDAFEEVVENTVLEPEIVKATEEVTDAVIEAADTTEEVTEAVIEAATDATEEVVENAIVVEVTEEVVGIVEVSEAVGEVTSETTEKIALDTIQDAVHAGTIAKENVENASETEIVAAETVIEALNTETEAVEAYAEAVKEEVQAADAVVEAVEAKNIATEAVIESAEQINELVENKAEEDEIKEVVTEFNENIEKQGEAEEILTEAIKNEDKAAEEVESTSTKEDQASDNLNKAIEADEKASENLEEAIIREEKAEEEVQETVETSKSVKAVKEEDSNGSEPFIKGDIVTHGVYGIGTVLQLNKAGKHWSVEVYFKEDKRRILGTFLTLNEINDSSIEKQEPKEQSFKRPETNDDSKTKVATKVIENNNEITEVVADVVENDNEITEVVADVVENDNGEYTPGTKILHGIFGIGEINNSKPKGEAYRLEIEFEDGTKRTLLSTFVELMNKQSPEAVSVEAEPVEAEPVEAEPVEAEPVEAEPVEAEPVEAKAKVLDTDIIYQRPKGKGVILDLSKPEIQDAEMIDDED